MNLSVRRLSAGYGSRLALRGIDLDLAAGEILAVIGPNGAGKSTLIKVLSGVLAPSGGDILFDETPASGLSTRERARRTAVVPQGGYLPPQFTVRQTVLLGRTPYLGWLGTPRPADQIAVRDALQWAHLTDLADRSIEALSGGEQQRVLLARALAQEAPVLLLDEPTTFLDLQHQALFLTLVRRTAREKHRAVLMVMHDLNLAGRYADRIALLVEGSLQAAGSPAQVLTAANLERAFATPVRVLVDEVDGSRIVVPGM